MSQIFLYIDFVSSHAVTLPFLQVITDRQTGKSRGYGFVSEYEREEKRMID